MALIKQYHRDTDTTYVYSSESYWDPDKKQARSRRKVVGKIDPQTGEMVPTGKRGRRKKDSVTSQEANNNAEVKRLSELYEQATRTIVQKDQLIQSQKETISKLNSELIALKGQNKALANAIKKINDAIQALETIRDEYLRIGKDELNTAKNKLEKLTIKKNASITVLKNL